MNWAVTYDLGKCPASYDFLNWLMNVEIHRRFRNGGPLTVRFLPGPKDGFRDDALARPLDQRRAIFENVMRPSLRLIGATEGSEDNQRSPSYLINETVMLAKSGIEIPTWLPPDDVMAEAAAYLKDRKPIVVTLREARYYPERNSNMVAWIEFARTCGNDVIFVRDTAFADTRLDGVEICSRAATDLLFRAALMLQAKANLMVANGPIAIAQFSKVPWLMFRPLTPTLPNYRPGQPEWWHMLGISSGSQLPWASAKQRIVWGDDTLLNIKTAWDKLLNDNSDAPNRSAPPEWSMSTSFILKPSRF